ncbi:hypothetical protein HDV02_004741 [Globomyces sp. JEL0801]|nr:hypothetical protein HDV02_004741 [Globomyces sp. JEL0801]
MQFALYSALALLVASQSPSTPEVGQTVRYHGAPRGSLLSLIPVDGAEFLPNQHFDVSIELHNIGGGNGTFPDLSTLKATVNGEPIEAFLETKFSPADTWVLDSFTDAASRDAKKVTPVAVSRVSIRSVKLTKPGKHTVQVTIGNEKVNAEWVVRESGKAKVKNLVLMIGDGMAPTMISAARYLSKPTKFGKFGDQFLNMEKGVIGRVATNGIDSIITDSANSAAAYLSGQKGWAGSLNVYSDTSKDTFDDPKVETLAEYIRSSRPDMCIGVVTTASVQDATPASVYAHTRDRNNAKEITDQMVNGFKYKDLNWTPKPVKADVFLGGGGKSFCNTVVDGQPKPICSSLKGADYYKEYEKLGYSVVKSKKELDAFNGKGPLLGIFSAGHMDTWLDRTVLKENLKLSKSGPNGDFTVAEDQPGLEQMTMTAIKHMSDKCTGGFFLLTEAASVDKAMHAIDYERAIADLLELDRTVGSVTAWANENKRKGNGETGIIVTADHAQAFAVYGTVDTKYFNELPENDLNLLPNPTPEQANLQIQKRRSLGEYEGAGWPDSVIDANGLPTKWDGRYRLLQGKVDSQQHRENFQLKVPGANSNPLARSAIVKDTTLEEKFGTVYVANKAEKGLLYGSSLTPDQGATVHSLQAVDLYCAGPAEFKSKCARYMDNTELFFIMADALGLGSK